MRIDISEKFEGDIYLPKAWLLIGDLMTSFLLELFITLPLLLLNLITVIKILLFHYKGHSVSLIPALIEEYRSLITPIFNFKTASI